MKILLVHNSYREPGGEDTVVRSEVELLRAAGHDVRVHSEENPIGKVASVRDLTLAPWNPLSAARIKGTVTDFQPNVAHVHNTWFRLSPAVVHAIHQAGIPVVMTLHNYRIACANALLLRDGKPCELCVGTHPWRSVKYRCYRDSRAASLAAATTIALARSLRVWQRNVNLFIALTEFARSRAISHGLPEDKIIVGPNFTSDPGPRHRAPSASDTLLFVGRLSHEKAVQVLLHAWELQRPAGLRLDIVGDGPLKSQIEGQQLPGVRLLGELERHEVLIKMLSARALIYPSVAIEGQPMVLLEALAAGLPILASDQLAAVPNTVGPLGREWLFPSDDAVALGERLKRMTDTVAIDRAGNIARATYERSYTPEIGLALLEGAYQTAIERTPA